MELINKVGAVDPYCWTEALWRAMDYTVFGEPAYKVLPEHLLDRWNEAKRQVIVARLIERLESEGVEAIVLEMRSCSNPKKKAHKLAKEAVVRVLPAVKEAADNKGEKLSNALKAIADYFKDKGGLDDETATAAAAWFLTRTLYLEQITGKGLPVDEMLNVMREAVLEGYYEPAPSKIEL